jgi:hypothetical protein
VIITDAEVRVLLGLETITDNERGLLTLAVPAACAKVIQHLGYDPEQAERTELLPRVEATSGPGLQSDGTDYNYMLSADGTRAITRQGGVGVRSLQLGYLPVRAITSLHVDEAAMGGQAAGAFAAATAYTQGVDFWVEFEEPLSSDPKKGLCRSGCLLAGGLWPATVGSVRVVYRAGYSPAELAGRAYASAVDAGGIITQAGVNAAGIKRASLLTAVKAFHTWANWQKSQATGFVPGGVSSESMGEYSYSTGGGVGAVDMTVDLPVEAARELAPFVNMGVMRL